MVDNDTPPGASMESSAGSSRAHSRGRQRRDQKRVGFGENPNNQSPRISWVEPSTRALSPVYDDSRISSSASGISTPTSLSRTGSLDRLIRTASNSPSRSHLPQLSRQQTEQIYKAFSVEHPPMAAPRPRPALRQTPSDRATPIEPIEEDLSADPETRHRRRVAQDVAFQRGKRLADDEKTRSEGNSRYNSPERLTLTLNDIPLEILTPKTPKTFDDEDTDEEDGDGGLHMPTLSRSRKENDEARRLVRAHTKADNAFHAEVPPRSGAATPTDDYFEDYRPKPEKYRGGILASLLKLYGNASSSAKSSRPSTISGAHGLGSELPEYPITPLATEQRPLSTHSRAGSDSALYSADPTPTHSPSGSGTTTPNGRHWFKPKRSQSGSSLAQLVGSSAATLGSPSVSALGEQGKRVHHQAGARPGQGGRSLSSNALAALQRIGHRTKHEERARARYITQHIAGTIARQKYLMKLCKGLMMYGAPTHRLEEYMSMSARVLEIDAQFLYLPGSMIMSFDDASTHTTEVKLVRVVQALDLGKLRDVHEIYKEVVHDRISAEEATERLKEVFKRKLKYPRLLLVFVWGLASVCVGPFAFGASFLDLPIIFFLGCLVGWLQLYFAPKSDLYANVFEVVAAVTTSFLARAFGSIRGGDLFCFSALFQSSIALILPGYVVLCASLELQSRNIVAGSIRMVYAIFYSFFLGFGITIGAALYGYIDVHATSQITCPNPIISRTQPVVYWYFLWVPAFTLCLMIINQAKWKQFPVMIAISCAGFTTSKFFSYRFPGNSQVASSLGALVIGILANGYTRVGMRCEHFCQDLWEDRLRPRWKKLVRRTKARQLDDDTPSKLESSAPPSLFERQTRRVGYGLAAAAMLPAIFVQVPSGLSVSGTLLSGLASANQITSNGTLTNGTTVVSSGEDTGALNGIALNVGYSVIQVAIGITVGLFLSAIVVYPFGKKRSGLFSF
ncbi:hypothetical protein B0A48_08539 [Cryoendolithus antarcticus]|uniref:Threonine/serine exporter-like N-terminal domain-containing protein n=1 Tax=Cryoendolithus antarcticus TaxID=1507870 RepID=A0A1V8T661_9PEZI|nr:hypothetical protein B0A48_08539 [Cryoendolithus antarcticus]